MQTELPKTETLAAVASSDLLCAFVEFPKITRLSRDCIITEKLDGTNAQVSITEDGKMLVGSRTRWITPEQDNYGFAAWAYAHREELMALGVGRHFGEWWGQGIQRKYGMAEKRWSLFNIARWCLAGETPQRIPTADPRIEKYQDVLPACYPRAARVLPACCPRAARLCRCCIAEYSRRMPAKLRSPTCERMEARPRQAS